MFCQSCGQNNVEGASFCVKCGTALVALSPYAPPRSTVATPEADQPFAGYAGFWKRFLAAMVDLIVTMIVGFVIGAVWGLVYSMALPGGQSFGAGAGGAVLGSVSSWLYFVLMESSASQATLGKMALGIVVTTGQGERISFGRANGRYFSKIISGIILGIGYMMAGFTEKKQALHDIIADTLVVNKG